MNVYCAHCETACSDQAVVCPKCGHPLFDPEAVERKVHGVSHRTRLWIAAANVAVMVIAGGAYLAAGRREQPSVLAPLEEHPAVLLPPAMPPQELKPAVILDLELRSYDDLAKTWNAATGWIWRLKPEKSDLGLVFAVATHPAYECLIFSVGFRDGAILSASFILAEEVARTRRDVCLAQGTAMMAKVLDIEESVLEATVKKALQEVRLGKPMTGDTKTFAPYVLWVNSGSDGDFHFINIALINWDATSSPTP
ncbi:MAG: hypothetical protein FLDDKLPJ_03419 [Phycisphaerae bacterium]|nr:hypothetical protein [Phycisphaerae bacterium]